MDGSNPGGTIQLGLTAGPRTPRTGTTTARSRVFVPMAELLRYLGANGFATYSASGGDRDYMRRFAEELYGIAPRRRDR